MKEQAKKDYIFPKTLIGQADLARLEREVELVDSKMQAQKVRGKSADASPQLPPLSQGLGDFVEQNEIDLSDGQTLLELKEHLRQLKDHAPVVHLTFAADIDPEPLQKIVAWLRQEVHPQVLVTVGLQPSLIGGVYMRTPNKVHDYSVKTLISDKRDIVLGKLEGLRAR